MSTSHGRFGRSRKSGTVAAGPELGVTYHYERIWSYLAQKGLSSQLLNPKVRINKTGLEIHANLAT